MSFTRSLLPARLLIGASLCVAALGCTGSIETRASRGGGSSGAAPSGSGTAGAGSAVAGQGAAGHGMGAGGVGGTAAMPLAKAFVTSPGLRRLTRTEYAHTVFDLLGVDLAAEDRPEELIVHGHSQIAGAQKIGYEDGEAFLTLGDKAATAAAPVIAAQISCADAACYKTWASAFLLRAFRAPPAAALVDRYAAMLTATAAGDTPALRVTTFLAAVLTSPHFLYRREIGTGAGAVKTLDAYEIASRLSYLVWQSAPDAALLAAAKAQALGDETKRLAELDRMLGDKRTARAMRSFVSDWMALFEDSLAKKDAAVRAGTGVDYPALARRSFEMLVDDVLSTPATARFTDLLKTDQTFADATLGKVMGVNVTGAELEKVTVSPSERLGVMMHPMVLGAHTKESGASPFPIGKFVFENVLCQEIGPPPAMFPNVEDAPGSAQTLRQKLEGMTMHEPCFSCHKMIGPPGFAFLPFDPIGRYKNADAAGKPFDTTGSIELPDGAKVTFSSAADLAAKLAAQPAAQACIARRMFRWAHGRFEARDHDAAVIKALETAAVSNGTAVTPLLRQIVAAPSFTQARIE